MQTPAARGRAPERAGRPGQARQAEARGAETWPEDPAYSPDDHARRMLHPDPRTDLRNLASDLDRLAGSPRAGVAAGPGYAGPESGGYPERGPGGYAGGYGRGADSEREYAAGHGRRGNLARDDDFAGAERADDVDDADQADASGESPVFVDATGNRRKMARRVSIGAVALLAGYGGLVAVSFAGGPIPPGALLPVPGMPAGRPPASGAPAHAPANPTPTGDHGTAGHTGTDHLAGVPGKTAGVPGIPVGTSTASKQTAVPVPSGTASATTSASTTPKRGNTSNPGHDHSKPSP